MNSKWFTCLVCITLAAFILSGCGGGEAPAAPETEGEPVETEEA